MTSLEFAKEVNEVSEELYKNKITTEAIKAITAGLKRHEVTSEEKDKIYANFMRELSNSIIVQSIEIVKTAPLLEEQIKKAKLDKLAELAQIKKNYGYNNATEDDLGDSTNDGMVDKQIEGFDKDMIYKVVKISQEGASMLAQVDIATPTWMTDTIKNGIKIMTNDKIIPSS